MTLDRREIVALDIPAPPAVVWQHVRPARPRPALVPLGLARPRRAGARLRRRDRGAGRRRTPHPDVAQPRRAARSARSRQPGVTHVSVTRSSHDLAGYDGVYDHADAIWVASASSSCGSPSPSTRTSRGARCRPSRLDAGDRRDRLLDRAGLHGVRGVPIGGNVQARRPDGTLLGGILLRKSDDLLVLRLHGITRGAAGAASRRPPRARRRTGPSTRCCRRTGSTTRRSSRCSDRWRRGGWVR